MVPQFVQSGRASDLPALSSKLLRAGRFHCYSDPPLRSDDCKKTSVNRVFCVLLSIVEW